MNSHPDRTARRPEKVRVDINGVKQGMFIDNKVADAPVLLVVHGGKSSRGVVRRSRQLLMEIGAKIVGVVLNNVSAHSHDYYYYHQRYYHDNYYSSDSAVAEKTSAQTPGL